MRMLIIILSVEYLSKFFVGTENSTCGLHATTDDSKENTKILIMYVKYVELSFIRFPTKCLKKSHVFELLFFNFHISFS